MFPTVDHNLRFAFLTITGISTQIETPQFAFGLKSPEEIAKAGRVYTLKSSEIKLINPNTNTSPGFRFIQDAELIKNVYRRLPVLLREGDVIVNPWGIEFLRMFDMANDSKTFIEEKYLTNEGYILYGNIFKKADSAFYPLYEGKMLWQYDHRLSSVDHGQTGQKLRGSSEYTEQEDYIDPNYTPTPRYWVDQIVLDREVRQRGWIIGFRRVGGTVSNIRTSAFSILPICGCSDSIFIVTIRNSIAASCIVTVFNSLVLDLYSSKQDVWN